MNTGTEFADPNSYTYVTTTLILLIEKFKNIFIKNVLKMNSLIQNLNYFGDQVLQTKEKI
jgi:hypothetical protein